MHRAICITDEFPSPFNRLVKAILIVCRANGRSPFRAHHFVPRINDGRDRISRRSIQIASFESLGSGTSNSSDIDTLPRNNPFPLARKLYTFRRYLISRNCTSGALLRSFHDANVLFTSSRFLYCSLHAYSQTCKMNIYREHRRTAYIRREIGNSRPSSHDLLDINLRIYSMTDSPSTGWQCIANETGEQIPRTCSVCVRTLRFYLRKTHSHIYRLLFYRPSSSFAVSREFSESAICFSSYNVLVSAGELPPYLESDSDGWSDCY